jgi:hypothetical protein
MNRIVHPTAAKTRIIRTPAAGPDPANTLVHLECRVPGIDVKASLGVAARTEIEFRTEFKIDGFSQQKHEWYVENTLVSATAMLRFLNTTTDLTFTFATDRLEPFLAPDGTLCFVCEQATYVDDEALFPPAGVAIMGAAVSAYVLCFEPRAETPPSGRQRGIWARVFDEPLGATLSRASLGASSDVSRHVVEIDVPAAHRCRGEGGQG